MTSTTSRCVLITAAIGLLAACGGGGGADTGAGTPTGSATAAAGGATTSPAAVSRLSDVPVPAGFSWQTVQAAGAVTVTVTATSRPVLGDVRVVVSNFIDKDPTGSGEAMPPMSTDVIATALASNAAGPAAAAALGALRFPAGSTHVLVEVFDMATGSPLASSKVAVSSLLASGLRIDV